MTIAEYLEQTFTHAGVEPGTADISVTEEEEKVLVSVEFQDEKDVRIFIGSQGETLESLELITRIVFQNELEGRKLIVDINGYREQREEKLIARVEKAANQVLETGRPYELGNLNAYERYLVHSFISSEERFSELETISEDQPRGRVLSIYLKDESEQAESSKFAEE